MNDRRLSSPMPADNGETNHRPFLFFGQCKTQNYQRTEAICCCIDKYFGEIVEFTGEEHHSYLFTGSDSYGVNIDCLSVNSTDIFDKLMVATSLEELTSAPIKVLDVGAGDFQFVCFNQQRYQGKIHAYGIAANDNYRNEKEKIIDQFHVFKNAEYLSQIYGENIFNYIFSAATYMHFCDPIGAVSEAYKALQPGGILFIDEFKIRGCEAWARSIVCHLKNQGHEILAGNCYQSINQFVIKKPSDNSKPDLLFPVVFNEIQNGMLTYKPSAELKLDNQFKEEEQRYLEGSKIVLEAARKINSALIKRCKNLPELFSDAEYLACKNVAEKNMLILGTVAQTISYDQMHVFYQLAKQADLRNTILSYLFKDIITDTRYCLYQLQDDPRFKCYRNMGLHHVEGYDEYLAQEQQLRIILIAAMERIICEQRMVETKHFFNSLNLPWVDKEMGYESSDSDCLNFPEIAAFYQRSQEAPNKPSRSFNS